MSEPRTSILGSEIARRGWLGVSEPVLAAWGLTLALGLGAMFVIGTTVTVLLVVVAAAAAVIGLTIEFDGRESIGSRKLRGLRNKQRRKAGEHVHRNVDDPLYGVPGADPGWEIPVPLGDVKPLDLTGTGLDAMFILEHKTPGDNNYYSVVLSIQGLAEGLRGDQEWAVTSAAFGRTLAAFARRSSLIRSLSMLHRSVPADLTPHLNWITETVAANPNANAVLPAVESYGQLIDQIQPHSEEHRCYAVLNFPKSHELLSQAAAVARRKNADLVGGIGQVILDETMRAVSSLQSARMGQVDVLGEQRACAVFRAFLDPTYPLDSHGGTTWENCWPSYIGGDLSVEVASRWSTRVALVRAGSIEPKPLDPQWHSPLLTGVAPDRGDDETPASPTIRTVAVRMDFVESAHARAAAKRDSTQDRARQIKEERRGQITDGTSDILASASSRRRADLMPGTGHHGVIWSMAISVTGRDEDDVLRACARVEAASDQSAIGQVDWLDDEHDVGMFLTVPLGRGLAATKFTRI